MKGEFGMKAVIDMHRHLVLTQDLPIQKMLDDMTQNNVERAVLLALPDHPRWKLMHIGGTADVLQACSASNGRLIPAIYVDPREGATRLSKVLGNFYQSGGRCLKMIPAVGYYPDDPALNEVWALINELGFIVILHTGVIGHRDVIPREVHLDIRLNSKYCQPIYLDALARIYPDISFVAAHLGAPWMAEAIRLAQMHRNIYLDCSGNILEELAQFDGLVCRRNYRQGIYAKIVFGTEGGQYRKSIEDYQKVFGKSSLGQHQEAIFYDNARGLLERYGLMSAK